VAFSILKATPQPQLSSGPQTQPSSSAIAPAPVQPLPSTFCDADLGAFLVLNAVGRDFVVTSMWDPRRWHALECVPRDR
jgi:hypothetical protein